MTLDVYTIIKLLFYYWIVDIITIIIITVLY